jgi:hypothetical protein
MPVWELQEELVPMAHGLSEWWKSAQPKSLSWEEVVRYSVPNQDLTYIGTLDWRAEVGGRSFILDLKTTGTEHGRGKYWDQWRLQLAAYRHCTEAVLYGPDDQEKGTADIRMVDAAAVIHLYRDGHVDFEELRAGPREHEIFLALRRVYGWRQHEGQVAS